MQDANPGLLSRAPFRAALILAAVFATLTFLVHFVSSLWGSHLGYGFFRDELYYLVCGHHLAWGYVDQPPLVAVQARIAETFFGLSPTGIRIFSFAAGRRAGRTHRLAHLANGRKAQLANTGDDRCPGGTGFSGYLKFPFHEFLRTMFLDGNDACVAAHRRWQLRSARVARFRTAGRPRR